jgi:uncharacterized protein (TIGR02266 family)
MAAAGERVGERQSASMRIKLKYPDIDTFIQKYAVNISRGGIFIATKTPKPVGTHLRFEFLISEGEGGTPIIRGEGTVQWTREFDPATPTKAHGMGVRFTKLDPESQALIERALAWREQQGPARKSAAATETEPPRSRAEPTRPIAMPDMPRVDDSGIVRGRPPNQETMPIAVQEKPPRQNIAEPKMKVSVERDPSREVRITGRPRADIDVDALAIEWGLTQEQIDRVLKRGGHTRIAEATAELERLLLKPAKEAPPPAAEAARRLSELLDRRAAVLEIDTRPDSEPANADEPPPRSHKRAR